MRTNWERKITPPLSKKFRPKMSECILGLRGFHIIKCSESRHRLMKPGITVTNIIIWPRRPNDDVFGNFLNELEANYFAPLASAGKISFAPSCRTHSSACWHFQFDQLAVVAFYGVACTNGGSPRTS
jgi:hypothetical protein